MGSYSHDRGIKLQLASGTGLAIRFITVSDSWKSNSSYVFPEIGLWWSGGPHASTDRKILVSVLFSLIPLMAG
jgi:hypothetical protein